MGLGVSSGQSAGWIFWGLGLGLSIVMLESRHRKWQGVNVSDFGGGSTGSPRSFDVLRTSGVGVLCGRPLALRRGSGLTDWRVGGGSKGLTTILRQAQDERGGVRPQIRLSWAKNTIIEMSWWKGRAIALDIFGAYVCDLLQCFQVYSGWTYCETETESLKIGGRKEQFFPQSASRDPNAIALVDG